MRRKHRLGISYLSENTTLKVVSRKIDKMKGCFLVFAVVLVMVATSSAEKVSQENVEDGPILQRFRRETCNSVQESLACDKWCRSIGLPGGACLRNKCDCDRF